MFSFARAKAELPVGFAGRIESIAEVRWIGEHMVQIVTKFPDPHSFLPKYNQEATKQVYEALLDIDFNLAIVPQLALAWKSLNPTTWEFKLRPDVTFHNGEPFTAADVVFSIERARAETSDFRGYFAGIVAVEAPDDRTVRFTTSAPDPSLWLKLAEVAILSKAWAERHDVTIPTTITGRARRPTPPGTRMAPDHSWSRRSSRAAITHWSAIPPGGARPTIRTTTSIAWFTFGRHDAEKLAALLDGKTDLLEAPPYSGLDQIRQSPNLKLVYRPKLYTAFFGRSTRPSRTGRTSPRRGPSGATDRRT